MRSLPNKTPRAMLGLFAVGSMAVMLVCLTATAIFLSALFIHKEDQRAAAAERQIHHSFDLERSYMAEEMWTRNLESISMRVDLLAQQLGNVRAETFLSDESGACLLHRPIGQSSGSTECALDKELLRFIREHHQVPKLLFNRRTGRYEYLAPLSVGPVLKGYVQVSLSDPYDFYRGGLWDILRSTLLPALGLLLFIWGGWLLLSRRLFLRPYLRGLVELEKKEALAEMARQVAHDIRNPLSALDKLFASLPQVPETTGALIRSTLHQMQDIAHGLLRAHVQTAHAASGARTSPTDSGEWCEEMVLHVVTAAVSEKRFSAKSDIDLDIEESIESYGLFARYKSTELKTMLFNMINNAIEASIGQAKITLSVVGGADYVVIRIRDRGKGIPADVVPRLAEPGATFDKAGGHGLGLYYAKTTLARWGGRLSIQSIQGQGTTVSLHLRHRSAPKWLASELNLSPNMAVVVVDDETAMHHFWRERLAPWLRTRPESSLHTFHGSRDFEHFWETRDSAAPVLLLCDYELKGESRTGMDIIQSYHLQDEAVLVTYHGAEDWLQRRSESQGIRILPKLFAHLIPIRFSGPSRSRPGVSP